MVVARYLHIVNRFQASSTVVLDATAASVYEVLANIREHRLKILPSSFYKKVEIETGGKGSGTVMKLWAKEFGRTVAYRMTVKEPEPGKHLVEEDRHQGVETHYLVRPNARGDRSVVTVTTYWEQKPGPMGWFERLMIPAGTRTQLSEQLELIEQEAQTLLKPKVAV